MAEQSIETTNGQAVDPTWADVAQASAEQDDTETKRGTMRLPCALTEHELAEKGVEHARGTIAIAAYEEETKALIKALKEERAEGLAALSAPIKTLAGELNTKQVTRDVDVTFCKSFRLGKKWIVRMDTGEELTGEHAAEPLTQKDRQQALDLPAEDGDDDGMATDDDGDDTDIDDPEAILENATDDADEGDL